MFEVWMKVIRFELWLLVITIIALAGNYKLITLSFDSMLWGVLAIAGICIIRIIAKGVYLNGNVE